MGFQGKGEKGTVIGREKGRQRWKGRVEEKGRKEEWEGKGYGKGNRGKEEE